MQRRRFVLSERRDHGVPWTINKYGEPRDESEGTKEMSKAELAFFTIQLRQHEHLANGIASKRN